MRPNLYQDCTKSKLTLSSGSPDRLATVQRMPNKPTNLYVLDWNTLWASGINVHIEKSQSHTNWVTITSTSSKFWEIARRADPNDKLTTHVHWDPNGPNGTSILLDIKHKVLYPTLNQTETEADAYIIHDTLIVKLLRDSNSTKVSAGSNQNLHGTIVKWS